MRLYGTDFALTFPQNETIPQRALDRILSKEKHLNYCLIAREKHQDGNYHLHLHLQYKRPKDIKRSSYFDYIGEKHGNYQTVRDVEDWQNYLRKSDTEPLEWGTLVTDTDNIYRMAESLSREEFFERCRRARICYQYAREAWNASRAVDTTLEEDTEIQGTCEGILSIIDPRTPNKSTVIIGPSGIGKTTRIKQLATKPALFVSHLDELRSFDQRRHKSIIFDDMCFTHIPIQGQIHLVDLYEPRSIHIRYGVVKIPAGVERWFSSNSPVFATHPAILRRINEINLY